MTLPALHHPAAQVGPRQLAALVEQLRERLGAEPPPGPHLVEQFEHVLSRLVMRNQRWRVLQRLERMGGAADHMNAIRDVLTKLDTELLQDLPVLLEHLGMPDPGEPSSASGT